MLKNRNILAEISCGVDWIKRARLMISGVSGTIVIGISLK